MRISNSHKTAGLPQVFLARPSLMVPGVRMTLLLAMAKFSVLASHRCP
ncbi:hypothetical protein SynBIOSE41_02720 [Synechococcus sp. BIOS-E4-1]|nr:hypothetical protein SynBIOSE41_02720 [Synechococcus sp. BIOS-E4-1]